MDYMRLGSSGLRVSRICLGCMSFGSGADWMLPEAASFAIVRRALELGINFFDTADVYSNGESELILGKALTAFGVKRDDAVVATKVFQAVGPGPNQRGLSRKHIFESIDGSLKRWVWTTSTCTRSIALIAIPPIDETLEALTDVIKSGKVRYIGASTMAAYQLAKMLYRADQLHLARFVSMQNNYSLLYREEEREMIPLCREEGVGLIPYSPIGGGPAGRQPPLTDRAFEFAHGAQPLQPQGRRGSDRCGRRRGDEAWHRPCGSGRGLAVGPTGGQFTHRGRHQGQPSG